MKVLFVTTNVVKWGGSEELWYQVAQEALKAGHEVMVSVFMHKPLAQKVLALEQTGAILHQRPFPSYFVGQRFTGRVLAELKMRTGLDQTDLDWKKVKAWQPQVVLISSGETFDYNISISSYLIKYCQKRQVPFYLMSQFNWEHDMDITQSFRASRALLTEAADGHFFVSYRNFKNAQMQLAQEIPKARIINNPLKLSEPAAIPFPESTVPRLASVARFQTFIKGQDLLLQALAHPIFKNQPFELNLYGQGEDQDHLENLIAFYNLKDKVFIRGYQSDVTKIWEHNQLLVLTSRAEGIPLSLLEAMYCGRSALVSAVGDNALWVENRGFVSASNTVEALVPALEQAFANFSNWSALGTSCRTHLEKNLNFNMPQEIMECLTQNRPLPKTGKDPEQFKADVF